VDAGRLGGPDEREIVQKVHFEYKASDLPEPLGRETIS
jgi:hypothetical protein